jgi:hypothetical protein
MLAILVDVLFVVAIMAGNLFPSAIIAVFFLGVVVAGAGVWVWGGLSTGEWNRGRLILGSKRYGNLMSGSKKEEKSTDEG